MRLPCWKEYDWEHCWCLINNINHCDKYSECIRMVDDALLNIFTKIDTNGKPRKDK